MQETVNDFQVFVKPVGPACNLACSYCYYLEKSNLFQNEKSYLMNDEVLEHYVIQQIEATESTIVNFSWHGGEPTLAGLDYFKKIVSLQKKYLPKEKTIFNGIQTNGTLLDEEWCKFLAKENFYVGISMDGPPELNDAHRKTGGNKKTSDKILKGYKLLQRYGIQHEVLCVVHAGNVGKPLEIYRFFKELGAKFLTFLPLVIPDSDSPTGVREPSVPSREFGIFMSRIFDEWINNDIGNIKIQLFEEASRVAFHQDHTLCIFKKTCGRVPVVEHTGNFYSCDHYVDSEHLIGNILDQPLSEHLNSERQIAFGEAKQKTLPQYCLNCEVLEFCNGECPKNRFVATPDGEPGLNYLCEGYKYFFNHCRPFVDALSTIWKQKVRSSN